MMSAQIYPFGRTSSTSSASPMHQHSRGPFQSFSQVCRFELPDPSWVSEDLLNCGYTAQDQIAVQAFFAWFGISVDSGAYPVGQGEAWSYLIGEFGPAAVWQDTSPQTFSALCGAWPESKKAYLTALKAGDQEAARELAISCGVLALVNEKMRTTKGPH